MSEPVEKEETQTVDPDLVWYVKLASGESIFTRIDGSIQEGEPVRFVNPHVLIDGGDGQGGRVMFLSRWAAFGSEVTVPIDPYQIVFMVPARASLVEYYKKSLVYSTGFADDLLDRAVVEASIYMDSKNQRLVEQSAEEVELKPQVVTDESDEHERLMNQKMVLSADLPQSNSVH